ATQDNARLVIAIEDDGPGIPTERADAASHRGVRLDEQAAGQGLGLSIARSYTESARGELHLTRSVLGGLRVDICWSR
ncbi:MAG: ATP-binding protein, partial [Brevundimonas sp.]